HGPRGDLLGHVLPAPALSQAFLDVLVLTLALRAPRFLRHDSPPFPGRLIASRQVGCETPLFVRPWLRVPAEQGGDRWWGRMRSDGGGPRSFPRTSWGSPGTT